MWKNDPEVDASLCSAPREAIYAGTDIREPILPASARAVKCVQVLQGKGLVRPEELQATIQEVETRGQKGLGAELVVKAWTDPAFKQRLLQNATKASAELGIAVGGP